MTPIAVLQQAAARTEAYRRAVQANKAILVGHPGRSYSRGLCNSSAPRRGGA
jgi:hypothetical protein